jgi:hypothetical protein
MKLIFYYAKIHKVSLLFLTLALFGILYYYENNKPDGLAMPTAINIGNSSENEQKDFSFIIKNISRKEIVITNLKTSCGCTYISLKGNTNIAPGDTRMIVGHANFGAYINSYKVTASIEWQNSIGHKSESEIDILGKVVSPLILDTRAVDFGNIDQSARSKTIKIEASRGDRTFHWDRIEVDQVKGLTINIAERSSSSWPIYIAIDPQTLPISEFTATIRLHLIQDGKGIVDTVDLPVKARITGMIKAVPDIVYVLLSNECRSYKGVIQVSSPSINLGNLMVSSDCAFIKASIVKNSANAIAVQFDITDPKKYGAFPQQLEISSPGSIIKLIVKILVIRNQLA